MFEIFSYWIFIWFLLYYFRIIKYNPLFILIIGYIITFFEFIYLILNKVSLYNGIKFFIINVIIKLIPIIILIKNNFIIINKKDILFSIYVFIIYIIVMIIFNKNPYVYYIRMINTYLEIKNKKEYKSIFSKLYDYILNKIYIL